MSDFGWGLNRVKHLISCLQIDFVYNSYFINFISLDAHVDLSALFVRVRQSNFLKMKALLSSKRREQVAQWHGVTFHKTRIFSYTAVRTSHLTFLTDFWSRRVALSPAEWQAVRHLFLPFKGTGLYVTSQQPTKLNSNVRCSFYVFEPYIVI